MTDPRYQNSDKELDNAEFVLYYLLKSEQNIMQIYINIYLSN